MKISSYIFALIYLIIFISSGLSEAQTNQHDDKHLEELHYHGDHQHEFGVSIGATHLEHDDEYAPVIHFHYSKRLGKENFGRHVGIGLGLETIIFEEMHYNLMIVINIYPYSGLEFSLSPGILFIEENDTFTSAFSFHAEAGYAFDFEFMEAGPVIGASFSDGEKHYSIGIHFGIGF